MLFHRAQYLNQFHRATPHARKDEVAQTAARAQSQADTTEVTRHACEPGQDR